ncbi:MAG: HTH-type transcriptional regulator DegA [Lentisphaerae bacterium ADurb.Bin242]|nr:MAG: HTH-type transcriptional regulator DegA [Lentisphaerae bacterium ADurb.Bin242]
MEPRTGNCRVNFRDIARDLGISVMTLYRVINNVPSVHPETRERVIDTLNKHGYYTHKAPKRIKVVFDWGINRYLDNLGMILMQNISAQNYTCFPTDSHRNPESYFNAVAESDIVVFFSVPDEAVIAKTREAKKDIYIITIATKCSADVLIAADNTRGGELAARHLHACGHKHVAVHLAEEHSDRMTRYKGFYAEYKTLNPESRVDTFFQPLKMTTERACLNYLNRIDKLPTAIFFLIGSYAQIFQFNVLPHDPERFGVLSIMSYDRNQDIMPSSELIHPFDRIEFDPHDLLDWAEYYIINRPMLKKRSTIKTFIDVNLVIEGSVRNLNHENGRKPK